MYLACHSSINLIIHFKKNRYCVPFGGQWCSRHWGSQEQKASTKQHMSRQNSPAHRFFPPAYAALECQCYSRVDFCSWTFSKRCGLHPREQGGLLTSPCLPLPLPATPHLFSPLCRLSWWLTEQGPDLLSIHDLWALMYSEWIAGKGLSSSRSTGSLGSQAKGKEATGSPLVSMKYRQSMGARVRAGYADDRQFSSAQYTETRTNGSIPGQNEFGRSKYRHHQCHRHWRLE